MRAWQQLALSGLIAGKYTGISGTPIFQAGINIPASTAITGGIYSITWSYGVIYSTPAANVIQLSAISGDGGGDKSLLIAADAYLIDKKIDDGNPSAGKILGICGNELVAGNCASADYIHYYCNLCINNI
jgi:hypothetical protein